MFDNLVDADGLGLLIDLIRDVFRSWSTVRDVVLDTEIVVGSTGVVTGGEEDTAVGLVLPDDVGSSRGGEDTVLSDDQFRNTIC